VENIKIIIGNRINSYRKNLSISQEELAYRSDLDRTYISSVENGKRNISLLNIEKICNALNIKISELFKDL